MNTLDQPLVSVVISSYNAASYIKRCLDSVRNQTYSNVEIIFVDSGSTDETKIILDSIHEPRLKYFYQENCPQGESRNFGIQKSSGKYITFLDTDDQFLPEKIEKQVRFLETHSTFHIVYCGAAHFYTNAPDVLLKKKQYPSGDLLPHLLYASIINPNAVMIARSVFENPSLLFQEGKEGRYAEEWILFLKLAFAGYQFGVIPEELVLVEVRTNSHTQWNIQWIMKETILRVMERFFEKLSSDQKTQFDVERILEMHKIKLAVAYFIGLPRETASEKISLLYSNAFWMRFFFRCCAWIPKHWLIQCWKWKQRLSFEKHV